MLENNPSDDDERELLKSISNDKSAFRVSVRLQRYFKDVRASCYIMVANQGQVRYLEQRIKTIFDLPGSFCLCTDGHLLPSSEPLALLAPGDVIDVIPLEETERSPSAENVKERIQSAKVSHDVPQQENSRTAVDGKRNDPYLLQLYMRRRLTLLALRLEHRRLLAGRNDYEDARDAVRADGDEAPPRRARWGTRSPEPRAEPERDQP